MHDFELRLIGHPSESGQILAQDMVNLAGSAQTLITRIARAAADRHGPGRSEAALEQLSRVRLTSMSRGSTVLAFAFGDAEAFEIDDPISSEIDETFWVLAEALGENRRPDGVVDSVAAAVDELIGALRHAAPSVEVRSAERAGIAFRPQALDRGLWQSPTLTADDVVAYVGVLEALDLRNGVFRIVDAVANRIPLRDVRAPHDAAHLVDQRVRAAGRPVYSPDGSLKHVVDVEISAYQQPAGWAAVEPELEVLVGSQPEPSAKGGLELTDEEFRRFLASLHG